SSHGLAKQFVIGIPGRLLLEMRFDTESGPVVQLLLHEATRRFGLQAERMAAKVDCPRAVGAAGNLELVAAIAKRIGGVEAAGKRFVRPEGSHPQLRYSKCFFFSPRNSRALPASSRSRSFSDNSGSEAINLPGSSSPRGNG